MMEQGETGWDVLREELDDARKVERISVVGYQLAHIFRALHPEYVCSVLWPTFPARS